MFCKLVLCRRGECFAALNDWNAAVKAFEMSGDVLDKCPQIHSEHPERGRGETFKHGVRFVAGPYNVERRCLDVFALVVLLFFHSFTHSVGYDSMHKNACKRVILQLAKECYTYG